MPSEQHRLAGNPSLSHAPRDLCIYLALTECHGVGIAQIRVVYTDGEDESLVFGSPEYTLDFTGHSPLEVIGVVFRLEECYFPESGRYAVQFWYNGGRSTSAPEGSNMNEKSKNEGIRVIAQFRDRAVPMAKSPVASAASPPANKSKNEGIKSLTEIVDLAQPLTLPRNDAAPPNDSPNEGGPASS